MTKPKDDTIEVLTLPGLAAKVGLHRTTLLRLEQSGVIARAPLYKGVRVYDEAMVKQIEDQLQRRKNASFVGKGGKIVVSSADLVRDQ